MSINFNTAPYYDDFDANDQFLRILFNPGRSVQARELTQIQSILQNQLSSGANHIWKDGTAIVGADIGVNKRHYIQLATADASWLGRVVWGATSGAIAKIVQLHDDETQPVYYIKPLSNEFVVGESIETYDTHCDTTLPNVTLINGVCSNNSWYNGSMTVIRSVALGNAGVVSAIGKGLEATIGNGILYVGNHFVPVVSQTIFLDYTSDIPTVNVGLDIEETIIEATSDPRLLDPASGFYNQNAPGADRYSINLKLIKETDSVDGTNFLPMVIIENGVVNKPVSRTSYTSLVDELARRTYDESGDYTTKNFPIEIIEDENDNANYKVKIESGKAYVRGYENELTSTVELTAPKGRTTRHIVSDNINTEFGPYLEINSLDDVTGVFDVFKKEKVNFITNALYTGGQVLEKIDLTKRITHFTKYGDSFRVYLDTEEGLDIIAPATYVVSESNPAVYAKLYRPTGSTVKKGVFKPWLYETARLTSTLTAGQIHYSTQKNYSVVNTGGTNMTIPSAYPSMHWQTVLYIYNSDIGANIPEKGTDSTAAVVWYADTTGNENVVIYFEDQAGSPSNIYQNDNLQIMANMWISNSTWKSITHTTKSNVDVVLDTTIAAGNTLANNKLVLEPGVSKIISITDPGANDVTDDFWFFEGDFDTEYKDAYVQWSNPDESVIPQTGTYTVTYEVFTYGSSNGSSFTAVNSFTDGAISYADIGTYEGFLVPNYYRLSDTLDFRCTDANFNEGNFLPLPGGNITVSYDYYLPRADRLILNTDGIFEIKQGFSSEGAKLPKERESEMTLYNLYVPPYTYAAKNISVTHIDNKNYKMSDLRELDERISSLEYYTALNLLEKDTASMQVIDSDGFERYKNGMLIDPFVDHGIGDVSSAEYFVSIYPEAGICTTPFEMKGYDFEMDSGVTGLRKSAEGKTWTLDFSVQEGWLSQSFASSFLNLNPFARMSWTGFLEISPSSDTWFEDQFRPDVVVQNENNNAVLAQVEAFGTQTRWGAWATTWTGWNDVGAAKDFVAGSSETKFRGRTRNVHGWEGRVDVTQMDGTVAANGHTNIRGFSLQEIWNQGWMATNTWIGGTRDVAPTNRPSKQFDMWQDVIKKSDTWKQDQTRTSTSVRSGTRTYQEAKDIRTTLDNKVLDSSSIGWMRSKDITIKADKLRPSVQMHFEFDGVNVDAYCKPLGGALGDAVMTDELGKIRDVIFTIPSVNDGLKFRTGKKFLSVQDAFDGSVSSQASASYTSAGTLNTRQRTVMSTLEAETKVEDISDTQIGTANRTTQVGGDVTTTTTKKSIREYYDPVAESFMVSNMDGGIFIDSIDIYFYSKDNEGTPVRIEIREMSSGYPAWSPLPLATKLLYPADVYTSSNGTANTRFTFADPIYLMNGTEYCFVVISDSLNYNIWISELGEQDKSTGEYINSQPFLGSMFTSQNNSTWTPEQTKDVKFQLNKCVFDTNNTGVAQFNMKGFDGIHQATGFTPNFSPLLLQGTDVDYSVVVNSDTNNVITGVTDGNDEVFDVQMTFDGSHTIASGYSYTPLSVLANVTTNNPNLTPVFNAERLSVITQNNVVFDTAVETHNQKGVYVSKMVQLANPADDLKMWLSVQEKTETYVKVFYDTGSVIPRYVDITTNPDFNSHGYYTVNNFEEEYAFTYINSPEIQVTLHTGPVASNPGYSTWNGTVGVYESSMYIDGDDNVDNTTRMYVTDISFPQQVIETCWVSKYDLEGAQKFNPAVTYAVGDIWFGTSGNDLNRKFYRAVILQDGTQGSEEVPLLQVTSVVDAGHVDYPMAIIESDPVVWREMKDSGSSNNNSEISTDMEFIEHTFEPLKKITGEFSSFRIKVELHTTNPVYLPAIRELRVLAVT